MRIEIGPGVFYRAEALPDLLVLFQSFIDGLHDWVAAPETIAVAREYLREHAPRLAETFVELARKGTVAVTWAAAQSGTVVRIENDDLSEHVVDLCKRPAVVVVENSTTDGSFIRTLCSVFNSSRLLEALANHWLEIEHGGGSDLRKVAQDLAQRYHRRVRVMALVDSDRMFPGQETQKDVDAARMMAVGVVVHVLELREAENYVPNRVLGMAGDPRDASRKLTLLERLTPEQRGYFDIKHGFGPVSRPPQIRQEQQALFHGVDREVLLGLRGGFGENLLTLMESISNGLTESDFSFLGEPCTTELRTLLAKLVEVI